jgi:5-methylcytosine-specific restriction endonuclease McrA
MGPEVLMKKGSRMSEESRRKMSEAAKARPSNRIGKKHTEETKAKISKITRERTARGEDHYAYSHGKAQRNLCDRRTAEYKQWRDAVFKRDEYTCRKCGDETGGNLRAHHIKHYSLFPEMRFDINNGITLCHDCHELEHFKPDSVRNLRKAKRGKLLY